MLPLELNGGAEESLPPPLVEESIGVSICDNKLEFRYCFKKSYSSLGLFVDLKDILRQ